MNQNNNHNLCWITWERQPRNKSMAKFLGCEYEEIIIRKNRLLRYIFSSIETIKLFFKRYDIYFVQNPSIVLCFIAVILKYVLQKKVVIDAHNAGVRPLEGKNKFLQIFNLKILSLADLVIVTNSQLSNFLDSKNVNNVIIPDPLPDIESNKLFEGRDEYVFIICSWAEDEPIDLYLNVARMYNSLDFVFSGNFKKYKDQDALAGLKNVETPGFVSEDEYLGLLSSASLVIDLTLRDDCLVCGAYESISLNKKVILSDNITNRELFESSAFYSLNEEDSLKSTIDNAINKDISDKILEFKKEYKGKQIQRKSELFEKLNLK